MSRLSHPARSPAPAARPAAALAVVLLALVPTGCSPTREAKPVDSAPSTDSALDTATPDTPIDLAFPLADPSMFEAVLGIDHDPTDHSEDGPLGEAMCTDYLGRAFPHCYDQHDGTDYILAGSWTTMDAGSVEILAAAPGVVVETVDGNYDRCHADYETGAVTCDGHEMAANKVTLEHTGSDGSIWRTRYLHMMKDSVAVSEGEVVEAGTVLGRVGSSGLSSFPHLHLELQEPDPIEEWRVRDPYAGPESQPESYWCEQGPDNGLPGPC